MRGPNMSEDFLTPDKVLETLRAIQTVIEGRVSRLEGLRKMKNASEFTQHEINSLEAKIIQLFGRQLAFRQKSSTTQNHEEIEQYPNLQQWLYVMDIHQDTQKLMTSKLKSIMVLVDKSEGENKTMMKVNGCTDEEIKRLLAALKSMIKMCNTPIHDNSSPINPKEPSKPEPEHPDDTDSPPNSPSESSSPSQKHPSSSSLGSDADQYFQESAYTQPITPPPHDVHPHSLYNVTPPSTPSYKKHRHKGTPPPSKKMIKVNLGLPDGLKRSKSSEASFQNKVDMSENAVTKFNKKFNNLDRLHGGSLEALIHRRHSEDSALDSGRRSSNSSPQKQSPSRSHQSSTTYIDGGKSNTLGIPKSPRTMSKMFHKIRHRFTRRNFLKPMTCNYCHDKILFNGYKCKECKYICHSKCKSLAESVPSCCLPTKYEELFRKRCENPEENTPSPILHRRSVPSDVNLSSGRNTPTSFPAFSQGESSSNPSSTTSSTPSSPAPFTTSSASLTPSSPVQASPCMQNVPQFLFPPDVSHVNGDDLNNHEFINSTNSDKTLTTDSRNSFHQFTDSECTLPGKQDSTEDISDGDLPDNVISRQHSDSASEIYSRKKPFSLFRKSIVSEWDIPFQQLVLKEQIGKGRFGPVYRGYWHGEVAIKRITIKEDDEEQLNAFKSEVSQFKRTRHENIILFTGACMQPPDLAIITNLCKGSTLYTHIHVRKDRFGMNKTVLIATQIAQGMGYLHAKGIIHKDLKSKNIFIENGKVVITDFALFSLERLSRENRIGNLLVIPDGWLCYLAPELIKALRINPNGVGVDLPFSEKTDMFAFGTVWYELLVREWPFNKEPAETIIWKVGKGLKQPLSQIQASSDVKEILMMCWAYHPESRPDFSGIKKTLQRLPKKRGPLHRSPSHPLHLSRSAESII